MSQRPELRRIAEADTFPHALARYAAASRLIYERVGALFGVLLAHGPAGDEVLADSSPPPSASESPPASAATR